MINYDDNQSRELVYHSICLLNYVIVIKEN